MIDIAYLQDQTAVADNNNEGLHQYVRALLARQQSLDLLESLQQQIQEVWAIMRRLLDFPGAAAQASQSVRVARAAQAAQAQTSYRALEKRREECIAALHEAERNANNALQNLLTSTVRSAAPLKRPGLNFSLRSHLKKAKASRTEGKAKKRQVKIGLNPLAGMTDAFIGN